MLDLKNPFDETRLCISPALIYEDGIYRMWCSSAEDFEGKLRTINYYEMIDGDMMELKSKHALSKGILSHIDVVKDDGKYWLVGNDVSTDGFPLRLYSFKSPVDSEYKYQGIVLSKGKRAQWDQRVIYRPSVVFVEGKLWLYYSAYGCNPTTKNHVGLLKVQSWKENAKLLLAVNFYSIMTFKRTKKLVSILTPCYNGARGIRRLLDSVLQQDYPYVEMIIVDDGSIDDSKI